MQLPSPPVFFITLYWGLPLSGQADEPCLTSGGEVGTHRSPRAAELLYHTEEETEAWEAETVLVIILQSPLHSAFVAIINDIQKAEGIASTL